MLKLNKPFAASLSNYYFDLLIVIRCTAEEAVNSELAAKPLLNF